jgi:hypothetical protein
MVAAAKILGAGLATIGLAGAGVGVGLVFAALINSTSPTSIILLHNSWVRFNRSNWSIRINDGIPITIRSVICLY